MTRKFYLTTIEHRGTDDTQFWGPDPAPLRAQVVAHCRVNWDRRFPNSPLPEDDDEALVRDYFEDHDKEFLKEESFELLDPAAAACEVLQSAFEADPGAITYLFAANAVTNEAMLDHPHIPCWQGAPDDTPTVSLIGIINGILSALGGSKIMAMYNSHDLNSLAKFQVVEEP